MMPKLPPPYGHGSLPAGLWSAYTERQMLDYGLAVAEACASIAEAIAQKYSNEAGHVDDQATELYARVVGQEDGAEECAAAIRKAAEEIEK